MLNIHTLSLGMYETNCYILYADQSKSCIVIDPGYEPESVIEAVEGWGLTVAAVILTHGHFDHVGGVRQIFAHYDCEIYLCTADCAMPETMTAGPLCYTINLQDGDVLEIAGLTLQILHTPGHTPGSVCIICENAMFSGDTLFAGSCGRTDLPGGNWDILAASLQKLKALEGDYTVYPGHGGATKLSLEQKYNPYMR